MNILIAPDKFKGSLTAKQVCESVTDAIHSKHPDWSVVQAPMADGGEGMCDILTSISGGTKIKVKVRDPLFREIETYYGLSQDERTAFIEMASASGLQLLKSEERNPRLTSSIGTGDLVLHALKSGVKKIILGCGGSATSDGGIGLASALGILFLDLNGKALKPIGDNLSLIHSINQVNKLSEILACEFILLSDVDNPLTGPNGASYIFARQKGASDEDIKTLDAGLKHFAVIVDKQIKTGLSNFKGAGAAGGFPISTKAFLNAEIKSGIEFIMEFSDIEEKIKQADLVITGEGKFDQQSLHGKVVMGLSHLCQQYQKRLWVICGVSEVSDFDLLELGIEKVIPLVTKDSDKEEATLNADAWIKKRINENL